MTWITNGVLAVQFAGIMAIRLFGLEIEEVWIILTGIAIVIGVYYTGKYQRDRDRISILQLQKDVEAMKGMLDAKVDKINCKTLDTRLLDRVEKLEKRFEHMEENIQDRMDALQRGQTDILNTIINLGK